MSTWPGHVLVLQIQSSSKWKTKKTIQVFLFQKYGKFLVVYRIAKSRFQSNTNTWQSKSNRCRLLFNFQKSKSDTIAEYSSNIEYPKKQIYFWIIFDSKANFLKCQIQKYFPIDISFKIARIKSKSVKTLNLFFWNVGKINFPSEIQLIFTKKWSILWLNLIIEYYRILRSNTVFSRIYSILKSRFRMAPK